MRLRNNNTYDKLIECVRVEGVREHQARSRQLPMQTAEIGPLGFLVTTQASTMSLARWKPPVGL